MMYTSQLAEALQRNPITAPLFAGVYPSNYTPERHLSHKERKRLYVINTQPNHRPGEHWVAIYYGFDGSVYYFDSYGLKPHINIYRKLRKFKKIRLWPRRIQGFQNTCGLYCLCFGLAVAGGFDLNVFGDNWMANDRIVRRETSKRFKWRTK